MDQAGRIVLPKAVRQELTLKPGDTFEVEVRGNAVTLTPNKEALGFVRKGKALVFSSIGEGTLGSEAVNRILEESHDLRHEHSFAGFRRPNHPA